MLFTRKKKLLGIDIGMSVTKMAELEFTKKGVELVSITLVPTPPETMSKGDIVNPKALSDMLGDLVRQAKTKRKYGCVSLWGPGVVVKRVSIPQMERKFVSEQIRWEAEQYVQYDVSEVNLGFEILNQNSNPDEMDILLVAAVQKNVAQYVDILKAAGLECKVIDVSGFALANCFEHNYDFDKSKAYVLANIGAETTNFIGLYKGEVIFYKDIEVGGGVYTSALEGSLNISTEEAENIKLSVGAGDPAPEEADGVLKMAHENIAEAINESVEFFCSTNDIQGIEKCYVTGGGAKVPGFVEHLSTFFACEKWNPFQKINSEKIPSEHLEQVRDFSSLAVGLALRQAGDT